MFSSKLEVLMPGSGKENGLAIWLKNALHSIIAGQPWDFWPGPNYFHVISRDIQELKMNPKITH